MRLHLLGKAYVTQATKLVHRGTGRDGIGLAALCLHILQRLFPALADADVEARVNQVRMGAHDARQQDVADPIVDGIFVRHPAFLDQVALHPDLGRHCGHHARVIGLHAADRDQRVGIARDRVRHDVFKLAQLVAAECQT